MTTSATASWLQSKDWANVAFVLVFDGLNVTYTTTADTDGILTAWGATPWNLIYSGLEIVGDVGQDTELFNPKVKPSDLAFTIVDHDNTAITTFCNEAAANYSFLSADATNSATTWNIDDTTNITSASYLYCGGDTAVPSAFTGTTATVTRGKFALFAKNGGSNIFGRYHRLDADTKDKPRVSKTPYTHYNRGVALYVTHYRDGAWEPAATAELVWSGRIKEGPVDEGDGRLTFKCESILGALQTTLFAHRLTGKLKAGVYVTASMADIEARVRRTVAAGTTTMWHAGPTTLPAPFAVGSYMSPDDLASAVSKQLQSWMQAGTLPGTTGTDAWSLSIAATSDAPYRATFTAQISTGLATEAWGVSVSLHPSLMAALGFTSIGSKYKDANGLVMADVLFTANANNTQFTATSDGPPHAATVEVGTTLTITDAKGAYSAQTGTIPGYGGSIDGFLKVGDYGLCAVKKLTATTFSVLNIVSSFAPLGVHMDTPGVGDTAHDASTRYHQFSDDETAQGVKVSQVWIEQGTLGDLMLKLLASTGTAAYNHATYDYFPTDVSVGIPWGALDTTSILDGFGANPYLLFLDEPMPFIKLFESALAVTGTNCVFAGGKIALRSMYADRALGQSVASFTENNKAKRITDLSPDPQRTKVSRSSDGLINRVTFKFQRVLGSNADFKRTVTINNLASQSDFAQTKSAEVEAYGIYEGVSAVSSSDGITPYLQLLMTKLSAFARPVATMERSYDFTLETRFFPGDVVDVTDSYVVDPRKGTRGVTSMIGIVVTKNFNWQTGVGTAKIAFSTELDWTRTGAWGPSARVDDTAAGNGYNGSDSLTCYAHQYSATTDAADASNFATNDVIDIVELSPANPASPTRWTRTIASVTGNVIKVTSGLSSPAWDGTKKYVIQYAAVSATPQTSQYTKDFISADATHTTGHAANDYYMWGGDTPGVSTATVNTTVYSKYVNTDDDSGRPFSVHQYYERHAALNTMLAYKTRVIHVNEMWDTTEYQTHNTNVTTKLVYVTFIPTGIGGYKNLLCQAYLKASAGTATARFIVSGSLVRGTADTATSYVEGATLNSVDCTTASTTFVYTAQQTLTLSAAPAPQWPNGYWLTVEITNSGLNTTTLGGINVVEAVT